MVKYPFQLLQNNTLYLKIMTKKNNEIEGRGDVGLPINYMWVLRIL